MWERMYKPGKGHTGNTICPETNGCVADVNCVCRMAALQIMSARSLVHPSALTTIPTAGWGAHMCTSRHKQGCETECPNGTYIQEARSTQTNPYPQQTCANIYRHTYIHSSPLWDIRQTQASTNTDPVSEQMQIAVDAVHAHADRQTQTCK